MKKWYALCVAVLLALCLSGCGQTAPTVSLYDLQTAMLRADPSLPEMAKVSSSDENAADLFGYLSALDYEKVDGFSLAYSKEGKADEIAVIAVKDPADTAAAVTSLREHVQKRVKLYTQYEPKQVARAEGAMVFSQGRYAVLIICEKQTAVKDAFLAGIAAA